jgi:hypothetical protein
MKELSMKRIMVLLSFVSIISVYAAENNKKLDTQKVEAQRPKFVPKVEFLMYPEDAHIEVDKKNLPEGVKKMFGNTFIVPLGMDEKLIHPTLVPKRIPDFEISMVK